VNGAARFKSIGSKSRPIVRKSRGRSRLASERETDGQRRLVFMRENRERFKIDLYRQRESDPRPFVYDSANGR